MQGLKLNHIIKRGPRPQYVNFSTGFKPSTVGSHSFDNDIQRLYTPQPSGLERYCRFALGGRLPTAGRVFSVRSSMELSRPEVVQRHGHLPTFPLILFKPWVIVMCGFIVVSLSASYMSRIRIFKCSSVQSIFSYYILHNCVCTVPYCFYHSLWALIPT